MRKDNELLILAKHGLSEAKKPDPCLSTTFKRSSSTGSVKGLTGAFRDYLTDIDVSSSYEVLPLDYQNHLDRKYVQKGGIDVYAFREWCRQLDADQEWIEKTERELF